VDHVAAELARIAADEAAADLRAGTQGARVSATEMLSE